MKFNTLKATFKGGMVSPRLRGRAEEGDLSSTAEKLENFVVDKVGGISKRGILEAPLLQPFINGDDYAAIFDVQATDEFSNTRYFGVNLKGREFIFRFDCSKRFNEVVGYTSAFSVEDYQSTFLSVIDPDRIGSFDGNYRDVRPYAPMVVGPSNKLINRDLTAFDSSKTASIDYATTLEEYLFGMSVVEPTQMVKVTDATVVFTSEKGISFTVSLVNLPVGQGGDTPTSTTEVFVLLPYFVNVRAFVANFGKLPTDSTYYCPIVPSNFPFNPVNNNKAFTVSCAVIAGQTGANTPDGLLSVPSNKLIWEVTVPTDMSIGLEGYVESSALSGKFISVPADSGAARDIVYFILKQVSSTTNTFSYYALQITGGVPTPNSDKWRLSTFGGVTHPKAVGWCFNRLVYGNAGVNQASWWASAVHPSSITSFQSFMQFSLTQDLATDVSKMQYEGVTTPKTTDIYRYGMQSVVPNLAPISFINSRRRIHFGTLAGETQLTIDNGSFEQFKFDQLITRSNSATLTQSIQGDGKIFYISNLRNDIRFISTEDRDYESLDGLMTTALTGLDLQFKKIGWHERISSIVTITDDNRLFFITTHEDTGIKAITEFKSKHEILDFFVTLESLYVVISYKGYKHICKYVESNLSGDIATVGNITRVLPHALGESVNIFHDGKEYTMDVEADGTYVLPFDIVYPNPVLTYISKVECKVRTMPVSDGGGNNSAMGDTHRIDRAVVQVDGSGPFRIGNEGGTIYEAEGLSLATLQTKYVKYDMPQSPDIENHLYVETDKPTPLNISGISYRGVSYSGE